MIALPLLLAFTLAASGKPSVTAKSAILVDYETGKVLHAKDAESLRAPASTTKVMTGLLLLEHTKPEEKIVADKECELVDGASLRLQDGEWMTADQMLWAIMLRSANDGCEALAKHVSGSVPKFVQLMNDRAKELGCEHTTFTNPHGLPDPKHKTTAHDLATIARVAMRLPEFRAVVKNRRKKIERSVNHQDAVMVSKNKFLKLDPTADGIKTGYTREAGHCYVGSATRNGHRLITVVLNSEDWVADNAALLNWGFKSFERKVVAKAGTLEFNHDSGGIKTVATNKENVIEIHRRGLSAKTDLVPSFKESKEPLQKGDAIGTIIARDADGFEQGIPAVALRPSTVQTLARFTMPEMLIVTVMVSGLYALRKKSRRLQGRDRR